MQFFELRIACFRRRFGEQAVGGLRFWEGHDVADRFGAGHEHDEAVEAEGDAAVRRAAVAQGIQEEAEFFLGFFVADAEAFEDLLLHVFAVDSDGAAADFGAVQYHVVGAREDVAGIAVEFGEVLRFRLGEGVVHGVPATVFFIKFKHGEVDDPERRPFVGKQS